MSLGDIHKKIYQRKAKELEERRLADDVFDPRRNETAEIPSAGNGSSEPGVAKQDIWLSPDEVQSPEAVEQKTEQSKKKFLKYGLIALGVTVFLLLAMLGLIKLQEATFSEEKVLLEITGPTEVKSGQEITYDITVTNLNRVDLEKVVLKLSHSEDFIVGEQPLYIKEGFNGGKIEIGTIASKDKKHYSVKAKTYGPNSKQVYFNGALQYQPSNFSSMFEKKAQLSGIIQSSLLKLSVLATKEAASGEDVDVQMIIKNDSEDPFTDVDVKVDYPVGFTYKKSDPMADSNNQTWNIGTIAPGQQAKIVINGSLEGSIDSIKNFKASIGKHRPDGEFLIYNDAEAVTKVIAARIEIQQTVNGKKEYFANAGDQLEFVIRFRNNTDMPLRELVLRDALTSPVLDQSTVEVNSGFYYSETGLLEWKAAEVPALSVLEAGQSGEVKFRVRLKDKFPMESAKDKNFVIMSQASIESLDIASPLPQNKRVFSNTLGIKVNSRLVLQSEVNYNDGELPNTGPIPMRVGQETTFTFRLNLMNTSNNLKNVVLTTSLAPGAQWKDSFLPEESALQFNNRTNELAWNIGTIDAGTGFAHSGIPAKNVAFQLGFTPSANQVNHPVMLMNPIKITAVDTFTNQQVEYNFGHTQSSDVKDLSTQDALVAGE